LRTIEQGDQLEMIGVGFRKQSQGGIFEVGYEQVGGDFTFGLLSSTYKWYTTLHEDLAEQRTIFSTRVHAGTTVSDAPPFEKYYAGGQGSIRGGMA
jgi:outer membrane protein assembly factor BamA